jgi:methionyl-tRNA formyltransferase
MRDQDAIDAFASLNADIGVMAFVTDIVPMDIIDGPRLGTINFHPSLLPEHRGPSSINWPIIQGKTKTGLSIFWPDAGLDTGPILLQKEVEIGPEDTLGVVYFDKIFPLGVSSMVEAVRMVADGTAPKLAQDHSKATYESWCKAENVVIDWSRPVADVYNLIRGSDPSPGANSTFNGGSISFFSASRFDGNGDAPPGHVIAVTDELFAVAASGGAITVRRVQPRGAKKVAASDWARSVGLKPGDRFDA